MLVVFSQCVLKVGDSGQFSVYLGVDMLTSATDKRLRSSQKSVKLDYRCDVLRAADIYTNNENSTIKCAAMSERDQFIKQRSTYVAKFMFLFVSLFRMGL